MSHPTRMKHLQVQWLPECVNCNLAWVWREKQRLSPSDWQMRVHWGVRLLSVTGVHAPPGTGEGWDETDEITASVHVEPSKPVLTGFLLYWVLASVLVLSVNGLSTDFGGWHPAVSNQISEHSRPHLCHYNAVKCNQECATPNVISAGYAFQNSLLFFSVLQPFTYTTVTS